MRDKQDISIFGSKMLFACVCVIFFAIFQTADVFSYPWHASCKIKWVVPTTCETVRNQLINQMNQWQGDSNCGQVDDCPSMPCGQNCLYEFLETQEDGTVKGRHLTPVKRYSDSLTFQFVEQSGANSCKVDAFSTSDTWYAILDSGTNYCNLRNLLDGTGLSGSDGFQEETSDSVCTQYSSRDCTRY